LECSETPVQISYLKGTIKLGIQYNMSNSVVNNDFVVYCDADWGGDIDSSKSTTGYISFFNGGPISWNSRLQSTVAKSSTEAEYIGLSSA